MNKSIITCIVPCLLFANGCASYRQLREARKVLAARLSVTEERVAELKAENAGLNEQLTHMTRVAEVLQKEKAVRIQETEMVRSGVRSSVKDQVSALREFSQSSQLLDYVGSELLARENIDTDAGLIIDFSHPLPTAASLVGGKIYAQKRTRVSFCLIRPREDELVVLWSSKLFTVQAPGVVRLNFDTPIAAQKGDLIGLHSPDGIRIPYDIATGDTRSTRTELSVGTVLPTRSLTKQNERTYSFGVEGFLDGRRGT